MPSYNERLTANNQKIDDITTLANELPDAGEINDKLDAQDEIIENLKLALDDKAGSGGGAAVNVFVQTAEPITKKGLWLKANKPIQDIVFEEDIFLNETLVPISDITQMPESSYRRS